MEALNNPWIDLPRKGDSYVLDIDCKDIERYNYSVRDPKAKVVVGSIPEPFIGNPETARVALLILNPGHKQEDQKAHADAHFRNAMFQNLVHGKMEYPFYPLNPAFESTPAGQWWRAHTRGLRQACSLSDATFASRLIAIEWFPYHSEVSELPLKRVCRSQEYSLDLARRMLAKNLPMIVMRSKKHWVKTDPVFEALPALNNPRRVYLTKGNMGDGLFEKLVDALQRET